MYVALVKYGLSGRICRCYFSQTLHTISTKHVIQCQKSHYICCLVWQCSATCGHGAGNKTRTVSCQQSTPSGSHIEVDITNCPLPVPHTVEECDNDQCPPYWIARSASQVRTSIYIIFCCCCCCICVFVER